MPDTMLKTLGKLSVGTRGSVVGFDKEARAYRKRLMAMGLIPGTDFEVIRRAPLGDPMEISLRGYSLSLRKREADVVHVHRLSGD